MRLLEIERASRSLEVSTEAAEMNRDQPGKGRRYSDKMLEVVHTKKQQS